MDEELMTEGGDEVAITPQSTAKQAFRGMRQWIEDNLVETPQKHKAIRQLILAEVNAVDCLDKHGAKPYEAPAQGVGVAEAMAMIDKTSEQVAEATGIRDASLGLSPATEDADILAAASQPLSVANGGMQVDEVADGSEG